MAQTFDYIDYRKLLRHALDELAQNKRGARTRLAEALGCQPSYLTQILKGVCDLSLEQAERVCHFFGHTDEECEYFLLLVSLGRAGSENLQEILRKQIRRLQEQHRTLNHRLKTKTQLSPKNQSVYYSHWYYSAVAIALTVPKLQTKDALSEHFKLPLRKVSEILEFLVSSGLATHEAGRYRIGNAWVYLGDQSELVVRDHINWRVKAIQALENVAPSNLHYSSVVSLSRDDIQIIKAKLIAALEGVRSVVKDSKEETVCSLLVDFFAV